MPFSISYQITAIFRQLFKGAFPAVSKSLHFPASLTMTFNRPPPAFYSSPTQSPKAKPTSWLSLVSVLHEKKRKGG